MLKLARVAPTATDQGLRPRLSVARNLPSTYVSTWLNYRAFNPLSLAPALWLDASDPSTITSSGGLVSQWNDKSGNGKHATGAGATRPTTGSATERGWNVLSWTDSTMTMSQPTAATTASVYLVIRTTDLKFVPLFDVNGGGHFILTCDSTNAVSPPEAGSGSPTYRRNGASAAWTNRQNTQAGLTGVVSVVAIESVNFSGWGANLLIGGYVTSGFDMTATIGEVLIFGSNLSTTNRAAVENYLMAKWT